MILLCNLIVKIFERHSPDDSLKNVRPIGNKNCFRDGIMDYGTFTVLWYEEILPCGRPTSRVVRVNN